jgi:hypothetical protein
MKIKINQRLLNKISNSDLDDPIKKFVKNILEIESEIGKGGQFSEKYKAEIEKAYLLLERTDKND